MKQVGFEVPEDELKSRSGMIFELKCVATRFLSQFVNQNPQQKILWTHQRNTRGQTVALNQII